MAVFARVQNLAFSLIFGLFPSRFVVVEESKFKMVVRIVDKCQLDHNRTRFSYIFGAFKFSQIGHFLSFLEDFRTANKVRVSEVHMTCKKVEIRRKYIKRRRAKRYEKSFERKEHKVIHLMNCLSVIDQSANLLTIKHTSQTRLYKIPP